MPTFRIACEWSVSGVMRIEAETLDEAKKYAEERAELPTDSEYLGDSFMVNDELTDYFTEEDGLVKKEE